MPAKFPCPYCFERYPTEQGLNYHYSRNVACRKQLEDAYPLKPAGVDEDGLGASWIPEFPSGVEHNDFEPTTPSPNTTNSDNIHDTNRPRRQHAVQIEEIEDEEARSSKPSAAWVEDHSGCEAGKTFGTYVSSFERLRRQQEEKQLPVWAPFTSEEEWNMAKWLMTSGTSQGKIDSFLKLAKVCV